MSIIKVNSLHEAVDALAHVRECLMKHERYKHLGDGYLEEAIEVIDKAMPVDFEPIVELRRYVDAAFRANDDERLEASSVRVVSRAFFQRRDVPKEVKSLESASRVAAFTQLLRDACEASSMSFVERYLDAEFRPEKGFKEFRDGACARSLGEAQVLAGLVIELLGKEHPSLQFEMSSRWDKVEWAFGDLTDAETGQKLATIGMSMGGVVSIDGKPFTPDMKHMNVSFDAVLQSLEPVVNGYMKRRDAEMARDGGEYDVSAP